MAKKNRDRLTDSEGSFEPNVSEATPVSDEFVAGEEEKVVDTSENPGTKTEVVDGEIVRTRVASVDLKPVCVTCNDTGAVAAAFENGVVTKWKDCPDCHRVVVKDNLGKDVEKRELNDKSDKLRDVVDKTDEPVLDADGNPIVVEKEKTDNDE